MVGEAAARRVADRSEVGGRGRAAPGGAVATCTEGSEREFYQACAGGISDHIGRAQMILQRVDRLVHAAALAVVNRDHAVWTKDGMLVFDDAVAGELLENSADVDRGLSPAAAHGHMFVAIAIR